MDESKEDRLKSLRQRITPQSSPSSGPIQASTLEGRILANLKLLKSLIRGERVRLNQFFAKEDNPSSEKQNSVEKLKAKIIDEFLELSSKDLALFAMPKKLQEECFDLLSQAWRKRIYQDFSQTLTLVDIKFSKESFRAFVIALSLNVSLKALRLDHCRMKPDKIKVLAVFLKVHPTIQVLHLDRNPLTDEGFSVLAQALVQNDTLRHLSCNKTKLTDDSLETLIELIKKRTLQTVSVAENQFSEESKDRLVEVASENKCVVTVE